MTIVKKMMFCTAVIMMLILFSGNAYGRQVLYAPFEKYDDSSKTPSTEIFIGEYPTSTKCFFYNGYFGNGQVEGKVGRAFQFDGTGYVLVPTGNPTLDFGYDDFAITFWVKTNSTKVMNTITDKRDSMGIGYHVLLYNGRPLLQMCDTVGGMANYYGGQSSPHVMDGQWHFVAIYVDRNNVNGGRIYVDGLIACEFNPTRHSGTMTNAANLLIGKHKDTNSWNFEGVLDELTHFRFIPK